MAACRAGLDRHPSYLSARVTLGRALQEKGETGEARAEFAYVLSLAPDNLAAIRGLAELHGGDGAVPAAFAAPAPAAAPEPESRPEPESWPEPEPLPEPESLPEPRPAPASEPDFAALDASIDRADASSSAAAEREAQIERLEIWLARLEQARGR